MELLKQNTGCKRQAGVKNDSKVSGAISWAGRSPQGELHKRPEVGVIMSWL